MDVPAPFAGTSRELQRQGRRPRLAGHAAADDGAVGRRPAAEPSKAPAAASDGRAGGGAAPDAVGSALEAETRRRRRRRRRRPGAAPPVDCRGRPARSTPAPRSGGWRASSGSTCTAVAGSGRKGRITREDVEQLPTGAPAAAPPAGAGVGSRSAALAVARLREVRARWSACRARGSSGSPRRTSPATG